MIICIYNKSKVSRENRADLCSKQQTTSGVARRRRGGRGQGRESETRWARSALGRGGQRTGPIIVWCSRSRLQTVSAQYNNRVTDHSKWRPYTTCTTRHHGHASNSNHPEEISSNVRRSRTLLSARSSNTSACSSSVSSRSSNPSRVTADTCVSPYTQYTQTQHTAVQPYTRDESGVIHGVN